MEFFYLKFQLQNHSYISLARNGDISTPVRDTAPPAGLEYYSTLSVSMFFFSSYAVFVGYAAAAPAGRQVHTNGFAKWSIKFGGKKTLHSCRGSPRFKIHCCSTKGKEEERKRDTHFLSDKIHLFSCRLALICTFCKFPAQLNQTNPAHRPRGVDLP